MVGRYFTSIVPSFTLIVLRSIMVGRYSILTVLRFTMVGRNFTSTVRSFTLIVRRFILILPNPNFTILSEEFDRFRTRPQNGQKRPTSALRFTITLGRGEAPTTLAQRACTLEYNISSINHSSRKKTSMNRQNKTHIVAIR